MKDKLLKQATDAANRAVRHYLKKEYDQFFIQAGTSFELLGKARLAHIHPSLIIDRDFDSFLHACSAGKHTKRAPWNLRTINATDVLGRCIQLHPELKTHETRLKLLAEYRNSTIHLGEVPKSEVEQVFQAYLAAGIEIGKGMELKLDDIFGEFGEMVSQQLDESLAEVQRSVAANLAHAKDTYVQRYGELDLAQLNAVVKIAEASYKNNWQKYYNELITCPVCASEGLASGDYELDSDVDVDRYGQIEGATLTVTLKPSKFDCRVCGLILNSVAELKAAGLPDSIDIEDIDPSDFYDGPYSEYM